MIKNIDFAQYLKTAIDDGRIDKAAHGYTDFLFKEEVEYLKCDRRTYHAMRTLIENAFVAGVKMSGKIIEQLEERE